MIRPLRWLAASCLTASLALVGCAPAPSADQGVGAFALERQALLEHLAHPTAYDWTVGRLVTPDADRLREATPPSGARKVQALASSWNASSVGFATTAATGRITGSPCYGNDIIVWLTEKGWVLEHNLSTGTNSAYQISSTDNFTGCQPGMSFDCRRLYVCSLNGNFYAFDLASGTNISGSPYAMGGNSSSVPVAPPPFVDPLASRPDGQEETVYALTQTGTLERFLVSALTAAGTAASNEKLALAQSYAMPRDNTSPFTEYFRSGPVVIGGKAVITTWRSDSSNSAYDNGSCIYYNTGATAYSNTATTGTLITKTPLTAPVWAPPSVEFDTANNQITPVYAFFPTGDTATMVDLASATQSQSVPLLVDKTTPTSGTLSGYAYTVTSRSVTLNPVTNGDLSIADNSAETGLPNGWEDLSNLEGCAEYSGTDATAIYGYTKFTVASTDVGSYSIVGAKLALKCSSSSNANGTLNTKDLDVFRVSDNLTTGTAWDSTNMTPGNRPPFEDGTAFTLTGSNGESSKQGVGINAGNSFKNGQWYYWGVNSLVTTIGTYSFGLLHPELPYVNTASNNGQPFKDSAPRFSGGSSPQLILSLSTNSLSIPTMTTPLAIDSLNKRLYAVNTNALYTLSYASATYDTSSDPFQSASLSERFASFSSAANTYFCLTSLGANSSAGPTSSSTFVANIDAPMYSENGDIYVIDNHPTYNHATLNRFAPPASSSSAPSLMASTDLTALQSDAKAPAAQMVFDFGGGHIFAATYDSTSGSNTGRAWVLSQI